jgi:hypothetical protein
LVGPLCAAGVMRAPRAAWPAQLPWVQSSKPQEPSDPQHQGIEREEDDEAGVATKLALDNEPDKIVSKVPDKYKADVAGD